MCKCELCGLQTGNETDFEVTYGLLDLTLQVCASCKQDLEIFGFQINQVIRLRPPKRLSMLRILGPVASLLGVTAQ